MIGKKTKRGVDIFRTYGMPERKNGSTWVVVSQQSHILVYEHKRNGDTYAKIRDFYLPEEARMSRKEGNVFLCEEVADFLEQSVFEKRYSELFLLLEPQFLGKLRNHLHPKVNELIANADTQSLPIPQYG